MTNPNPAAELGTPEFWQFYDRFCSPKHLTAFIQDGKSAMGEAMQVLMRIAYEQKVVRKLSRPERHWDNYKAWLCLRNEQLMYQDGSGRIAMYMRAGDVVVVEHGWDRDIPITHSPIERGIVSGYFVHSGTPERVGLFMPLFTQDTILKCIELRLEKNMREAMELAHQEARDWGWY